MSISDTFHVFDTIAPNRCHTRRFGLRMPFTTIRSTLLALIGSLGALILLLVAVQMSDLIALHGDAKRQFQSNIARNHVARAALSLSRERDATFLALTTGSEMRSGITTEADQSLAAHLAAMTDAHSAMSDADEVALALLSGSLPDLRQAAAAALELPLSSQARQDAALRWFDDMSTAVEELRAFRLRLLNQNDMSQDLFGLSYLRTHTLVLLDELMKNATLLEAETAAQALFGEAGDTARVRQNGPLVAKAASEVEMSIGPFEDLLASLGDQGMGPGVAGFDAAGYRDAEQNLRLALQTGEGLNESLTHWRRVSNAAILQLDELQAGTFRLLQTRTQAVASQSQRHIALWALLLWTSAVIVVIAVRVVFVWVVAPLERMRAAMLQLAEDNLSVTLPMPSRLKEIGAMEDALRVFRANGVRRQALQRERHKLHGRLEQTYSHIKTDLEAAAAIQASLLPRQAQLSGVQLSSYFRPSHFLAGDTFDVLQEPDGRVIAFQIDVAGHGAAAALASIASKYTVAQAILQRRAGADLAELAQDINREWPSDLPYFTLVLTEIDPSTGQGVMVQAGHPSPILLRSSGQVVVLGDGGLPIGVLAQATFDAIPFEFGLNDRLILATDGVHEMENADGEPFSEERVQDILRGAGKKSTEQIIADLDASLRMWRGDDTLDDDATIVILEGRRVDGHH